MCGRYELIELESGEMLKVWVPRSSRPPSDWRPNADVRPTDPMPIVRLDDAGEPRMELRRWGFLRRWFSGGKEIKRQLFNAVGEDLSTTRAFKNAFLTAPARCIVPMNAWYEWPVIDGVKQRVRISLKDRPLFGVAGLYEESQDLKTGKPVDTFTVVTVDPNHFLSSAHDRAPLVLQEKDYDTWLDPGFATPQALIEKYPHEDAFEILPVTREEEAALNAA